MYLSNIWKIGLIIALSQEFLMGAVFMIFMLGQGLGIVEASWVVSGWLLLSSVGQVPAGMFADRFGMKSSIVLGSVLSFVGAVCFALSTGFWMFMVGYGLMGLGSAFVGGADSALLYESMKFHKREKQFKKTLGTIYWWTNLYGVVACIGAGLLYAFLWPRFPFVLESVLFFMKMILSFILKEPALKREKVSVLGQVKKSFLYAFTTKKFSKIYFFSALIGSVSLTLFQYLQPLYSHLSVSVEYFGLFAAFAFFVKGLGSLYSEKLGKLFSIDHYLVVHATVFGLFLVILQQVQSWIVLLPLVGVFYFLRGIYVPTVSTFIHEKVPSTMRATMVSLNDQMLFFWTALSMFLVGEVISRAGIMSGVYLIAVGSLFFLLVYSLVLRDVKVE